MNKGIDRAEEFLNDWFNHQRDDAPLTKPELKEVLSTMLEMMRELFGD